MKILLYIIAGYLAIFATTTGLVEYKVSSDQTLGGTVLFPYQGGTGTSTTPSDGQLLVGNDADGYDLVSTSSLGITGDMTALAEGNIYVGNASNIATATSTIYVTGEKVGIGTTTPIYALDVNGVIRAVNDLYIGNIALSSTSSDHTSGADLVGIPVLNGASYTSVHEALNLFSSSGRATGGLISTSTGETVSVAAGTGFIKATDSDIAELLSFDWVASSSVAIPTNTTQFIGIKYNTGVPIVDVRTTQNWDLDTEFPLGSVINLNGTLYILNNPWWVTDGITNLIEKSVGIAGYLARDKFVGGAILGVTGTRNPTMSAGTFWGRTNEFEMSAIDYSIPTGVFSTYWFESDGTVHEATTTATQYPITQWNDVDNDQLDTIGNNKYANWWVMINITNNELALIYPQATFVSAAGAEAEAVPSTIPADWYLEGDLIGRILFKQGVDAPIEVQSSYTQTFSASQAADHGNLAGLTDDDHLQYVLHNGTRTWTGNQNLGGFNLGNIGSATGTSAIFTSFTGYLTGNVNGTASSSQDLTCTDCINATEIEDIYVLNTSDTMSGTLGVTGHTTLTTASSTDITVSGTSHLTTILGTTATFTSISGYLTGDVNGNASTSDALAANPTDCSAGSYALGIDADGTAAGCTDATTEIDSAISTHNGSSTTHQNEVTLEGTPDYITIAGQVITRALVNLVDDITGILKHENGGLEADTSAYSGLVAISGGSTSEVDAKSELEAQIADVDDFAEADGDTYTNAHDFGGAVLEIPNGSSPTVDATGEMAFDTTDNQLIIYDGSIVKPIRTTERLYGFTVASTSGYFTAGEQLPIPPELDAYTVTHLRCFVDGGTNKIVFLTDGTNDMDSMTCLTTLTSDDGTIANNTATAGELMYAEFGATSGVVQSVTFSAYGYYTRE